MGEGHGEGFLIASTLKNKTSGRQVQGCSLVMWPMPHPLGASWEPLTQAGRWRWALACVMTGDLQKEPVSLRTQGGDAEAVHAVDTTTLCTITARGTSTQCCPAPQENSWVRNQRSFSVPSKESHKYSLNSGCFPLLSHGLNPPSPKEPSDSFTLDRAKTRSQNITQGGEEHLEVLV